jgi:hypothetical protein
MDNSPSNRSTTICKTIDLAIYFVAHEGENPSNEEGFSLV